MIFALIRHLVLQEAHHRPLVPLFGEKKVHRLAGLIHCALAFAPLTFDFEIGLVQPPTKPDRPLAAVKRRFQLETIFHDLAIDCRMVDKHATFLHQLFDMTIAQRIHHVPPDAREDDLPLEMGPFEAHLHPLSSS
jgi:hypothetical protein